MCGQPIVVGVVGPCGAGKTTLVGALRRLGFNARHIAQEHSYVPSMWQRISHPDTLIYLHASYATTVQRRKLSWSVAEYEEQIKRLEHARLHANLYIDTDELTPQEVLDRAIFHLKNLGWFDGQDD